MMLNKRSLLAFAAAWGAIATTGCSESPVGIQEGQGLDASRAGAIRVLIALEGVPTVDGSNLQVDGAGFGSITAGGALTVSPLSAGEHEVQLVDVPTGCEVIGDNPRAVVVQNGVVTPVTFTVRCHNVPL